MRFSTPRPFATLATSVALAGTLGLAGGATAMAQEATPIGPEATCVAPAGDAAMAGSPTTMASPAAGATAPEGTVVEDQATIDEATAAIENLYACYNAGDGASYVALYTDSGLQANWPGTDRGRLAAEITAISGMAPASEIDVHEVLDLGDGSLGVDYQVTLGHQVWHVLDTFVEGDGAWLVDGSYYLDPETDLDSTTASVKTSVADGQVAFEVSPSPLMNQPAVKLQLTNTGDSETYIALLQGGDAASLTEFDVTNLPAGMTFVGEETAEPGQPVIMLLEHLDEGSYVLYAETDSGETGAFDLTIDPPFDPNA